MGSGSSKCQFHEIVHDCKARDPSRPMQGVRTERGQKYKKEGCCSENGEDRRTLYRFNVPHCLCPWQLEFEDSGKSLVGTGACFRFQDRLDCILTCAHNVCDTNLDGVHVQYSNHFGFEKRWGVEIYRSQVPFTRVAWHPKYNGDPACGYDIALLFAEEETFTNKFNHTQWSESYQKASNTCYQTYANPSDLYAGLELLVCGYPGDPDKIRFPYEHRGPIAEVKKTALGGCIVTYKVDTSRGDSGSPLYMVDTDWVEQRRRKDKHVSKWLDDRYNHCCIGVHTGTDTASKVNYGTFLTLELGQWINDTCEAHLNL